MRRLVSSTAVGESRRGTEAAPLILFGHSVFNFRWVGIEGGRPGEDPANLARRLWLKIAGQQVVGWSTG